MSTGGRKRTTHDKRTPEAQAAAVDKVWATRRSELERAYETVRTLDALDEKIRDEFFREMEANPPANQEEARKRFDVMLAKKRRATAPQWKILEQIETGRLEEQAGDKLPFGDQALDALRALRREHAEIVQRAGRGSDEYQRFMRERFVPQYNDMSTDLRVCERCFKPFALTDTRARFCSATCGSAIRNRGRPHDGLSEVARSERAKRRISKELQLHWQDCARCKKGGENCRTASGLMGAYEPFTLGGWSDTALSEAARSNANGGDGGDGDDQ